MPAEKTIAENRKAYHDYFIEEVIEAGLVLSGTEVKSLRLGRVNLRDSFARIDRGEAFLMNCHIAPYEQGNRWNHDPYRTRKLLLHKREIRELLAKSREKGYTLVPVRMYFDQHGRAKVALAVARGKKVYDKRQSIAQRDAMRQIDRALKERRR
ncbi:MAG: SsrA-binding protein SmpB [Firmicutes bacterium]|nr:SsrA-binding protein SmpB [Bacillota bacterium]